VKKLALIGLLSVLILPAQVAFAILPMDAIFAAQVFSNVEDATSVEYTLTANLQVDDTEGEEVADLAATLEGAWESTNGNEISSFDGAYVGTVLSDEVSSGMSSAVLANERFYFLDTWSGDDTWYYFSNTAETEDIHVSVTVPSEDEIRDEVFEIFSKGLVETDRMSDHWVDGVLMQKYSYTVNTDVLIDLQDNIDEWSAEEVAEAKAYANEHITATGEIWIDKDTMYPYLINMTAVLNDSEVGYATLELELVFDSFNETLNLSSPSDALDIMEMYIEDDSGDLFSPVDTVDSDGDGLTDSLEIYHQTNLSNPDSDGDGYTDYEEVMNMYNPNGPGQMDSDQDGLGDRDEVFIWYTDRFISDTDGDGYGDQTEVLNGYDPNGPGRLDSDFDGITNFDEIYVFGTDPFATDTDKDGYNDGEEIFNGYNPLGSGRI
jgi:hypothetical protein